MDEIRWRDKEMRRGKVDKSRTCIIAPLDGDTRMNQKDVLRWRDKKMRRGKVDRRENKGS